MRQFTRRKEDRVEIYFGCQEEMDRITDMLKRVDHTDIMFTAEFLDGSDCLQEDAEIRIAGFRVKFGKGWTGKDAEIHKIDSIWGPEGITVSINIFQYAHYVNISFCTIRNLKDKEDVIHLGEPAGIFYKSCRNSFPPMYDLEDVMEEGIMFWEREEINGIEKIVLNWEEETLDDMQIEAEMEEALQGQID